MRMSSERIVKLLARYTGVTPSELVGPSRLGYIVEARHAAMVIMRERMGLTYPHIAKIMGNRHHSVGIYAVQKPREGAFGELIRDLNRELDAYVAENHEYLPRAASEQEKGTTGPL